MNKIQPHLKNFGGRKTLGLASRILAALTLFIFFGLSNSVWAYEQAMKALKEESLMDFPKQAAPAPFSYNQLQRKGYIFGIKMNFEVNTIWSKPKDKLKSEQLISNYFSDSELLNEFPLDEEIPIGAIPVKLFEIRF